MLVLTVRWVLINVLEYIFVFVFLFSLCSFLSLQEKEGFSLCLCLGFDQRIFVDVCRGEIQLVHEGLVLRFNLCCFWVC